MSDITVTDRSLPAKQKRVANKELLSKRVLPMANFRFIAFPLGLLLRLSATAVYGQRFQPFGPLDFTQDLQPVAPAEISSYGGGGTGAKQAGPDPREPDQLWLHVR